MCNHAPRKTEFGKPFIFEQDKDMLTIQIHHFPPEQAFIKLDLTMILINWPTSCLGHPLQHGILYQHMHQVWNQFLNSYSHKGKLYTWTQIKVWEKEISVGGVNHQTTWHKWDIDQIIMTDHSKHVVGHTQNQIQRIFSPILTKLIKEAGFQILSIIFLKTSQLILFSTIILLIK